MDQKIGSMAFLVGVTIAVISGFFVSTSSATGIVAVLLVLGLAVGYLNITPGESTRFLVATMALMVALSGLRPALIMLGKGLVPLYVFGTTFHNILTNLLVFVAPAAVVVALKEVYRLSVEK